MLRQVSRVARVVRDPDIIRSTRRVASLIPKSKKSIPLCAVDNQFNPLHPHYSFNPLIEDFDKPLLKEIINNNIDNENCNINHNIDFVNKFNACEYQVAKRFIHPFRYERTIASLSGIFTSFITGYGAMQFSDSLSLSYIFSSTSLAAAAYSVLIISPAISYYVLEIKKK
jgi:hypothetical protein